MESKSNGITNFLLDKGFRDWALERDTVDAETYSGLEFEDEQLNSYMNEAKMFLVGLHELEEQVSGDEIETNLEYLRHSYNEKFTTKTVVKSLYRRISVAATILILISLGVFGLSKYSQTTRQVYTSNSQRKHIQLPDGSQVFLNNSSSITYKRVWFKKDARTVHLNGEAFFDIAKQDNKGTLKKFTVTTDDLEVEVFGTSFSVNNSTQNARVVLHTGKVGVNFKNNKHFNMYPGDVVEYNKADGKVASKSGNYKQYLNWVPGIQSAEIDDEYVSVEKKDISTLVKSYLNPVTELEFGTVNTDIEGNNAALNQQGRKNRATIDQQGESNQTSAWSEGKGNTIDIDQSGSNNSAGNIDNTLDVDQVGVYQQGKRNSATVNQDGENNNAQIFQIGKRNTSEIVQDGEGNSAVTLQKGSRNEAYIEQVGSNIESEIIQQGSNNKAEVNYKSDNTANNDIITYQEQKGVSNESYINAQNEKANTTVTTWQWGQDNYVMIDSEGSDSEMEVGQDGKDNITNYDLIEGFGNTFQVNQFGNQNQVGTRSNAGAWQQGNENSILIIQQGNNNQSTTTQLGNSNTAKIKQDKNL